MKTNQGKDVFRDSIGTINGQGGRQWIYPKKPKGKLYDYRKYVSYILLLMLFSFPFIKVDGNQFILLNVFERRFNFFGVAFWPQDFYIVVVAMIIGLVFVTLFTVMFGRVFCGWICPQTIFMEMVFRRIEYTIEGDKGAQRRLDKQKWNFEKIYKKTLKTICFLFVSFFIANIFLAYFTGADRVLGLITKSPSENTSTFVAIIVFTGMFYFIFSRFREQVCIIVCPYGRLQSVLLDNNSINVAYDHIRGEKTKGRAIFNKKEDREASGKGDCVDCNQCVEVCPTGIDIRNGIQLECVNCTACIDACDTIMEGVDLPKGLIRFASEDNIVNKQEVTFSNRIKGYIAVLSLLFVVLVTLLFLRNDIQADVLRIPGALYQMEGKTKVKNVFTYKLLNKTNDDLSYIRIELISHQGEIRLVGNTDISIGRQARTEGTFFVIIDKKDMKESKDKIKIGLFYNNELIETTTSNFIGPRSYR
ncbi:MAG: cytochrome c oxidase accessory protein CcoG [Flavobacteriaceae bacterium]|nr:cytochrome c oxidase accessory protein CcoG [Flavobacteriaceae bacterium]